MLVKQEEEGEEVEVELRHLPEEAVVEVVEGGDLLVGEEEVLTILEGINREGCKYL